MTITKEQLSDAEKACLEFYEYLQYSVPSESAAYSPLWHVGKAIHEKLNAKKKVDYSVLIKHKIDCSSPNKRVTYYTPYGLNEQPKPRLNHWFSALNFEDVERVVEDLRAAGFDVETNDHEGIEEFEIDHFKINGASEGCEL